MIAPLFDAPQRHPGGWRYRMTICGAYELRQGFATWEGTHILSIQRSALPYRGPVLAEGRHLLLDFEDVANPSLPAAPTFAHLAAAMAFIDGLPREASLVIHCLQGISRSTSLALGLLAREVPPMQAAALLHSLRPFACPNALVVRLWDELLGLDGALIDAAAHFPTVTWKHGDGRDPPALRRKRA